jgi:hypothetical protein
MVIIQSFFMVKESFVSQGLLIKVASRLHSDTALDILLWSNDQPEA